MIRVRVTLTGASPLLMNPATDDLVEQLRTRTTGSRRRDWSREEEAATKLYFAEDGTTIGIPVTNLLASLVEAGRDVDLPGRKKISTASSTRLYSFMTIDDLFLPFPAECQVWTPDVRRGRNPNGGEMVAITRPRFDHWSLSFDITVDDALIDLSKIRELFDIAGRSVGLCDFRPSRRGPFGRSTVTTWEVIEGGDPSTNGRAKELVGAGA